jgi:hypothetical protein
MRKDMAQNRGPREEKNWLKTWDHGKIIDEKTWALRKERLSKTDVRKSWP